MLRESKHEWMSKYVDYIQQEARAEEKKNEKRTDRGEEEEKTETFITVWKQRYREKNVSFFNIQRSSLLSIIQWSW